MSAPFGCAMTVIAGSLDLPIVGMSSRSVNLSDEAGCAVYCDGARHSNRWKVQDVGKSTHHAKEFRMITFQVNDMTCGHCVGTITRALKDIDPQVDVRIDLQQHRVDIDASKRTAQELQAAIAEAGYTPVAV